MVRGTDPTRLMDIDTNSRLQYAELLRHFAAGHLTNDEYVDAANPLIASRDPSLWAIWWSVWFHYDDVRTHRLVGKWKLLQKTRRNFTRAIVFLHSGLPYEWPVTPLWRKLMGLLTLGIATRLSAASRCAGDKSVWPFFKRSDMDAVVACPWQFEAIKGLRSL